MYTLWMSIGVVLMIALAAETVWQANWATRTDRPNKSPIMLFRLILGFIILVFGIMAPLEAHNAATDDRPADTSIEP